MLREFAKLLLGVIQTIATGIRKTPHPPSMVIGAGAGAAAGAGEPILTRGRRVPVPPESMLTFRLEKPLVARD